MRDNLLQYRVEIKVNGSLLEFHSCEIRTGGVPGPDCEICFPKTIVLQQGWPVTVTLAWMPGKSATVFTGRICSLHRKGNDKATALVFSSNNQIYWTTIKAGSWQQTAAREIIIDLLQQCKIDNYNLDHEPAVTVKRFSHGQTTAKTILQKLINTLASYGQPDMLYFFDHLDTFRFGSLDDTRIAADRMDIQRGVNLIRVDGNRYEAFALPVQYNQVVHVDDQPLLCATSHLYLSPARNRIEFTGVPCDP